MYLSGFFTPKEKEHDGVVINEYGYQCREDT